MALAIREKPASAAQNNPIWPVPDSRTSAFLTPNSPKFNPPRKSNPPNDWMAKAQPRKTRESSRMPAKIVTMPASAQAMTVHS